MDKLLFKLVESVWGRNLLYTLLLMFCAAIFMLAREVVRQQDLRSAEQAACRNELMQLSARNNTQIDELRMEQIATLERILKEQKQLNERVERR